MWPYPRILAHRGGGTLAPENTYAGLRCGMAAGFRAIEFDVMLARDGVPVVMHDPGLGRTVRGSGLYRANREFDASLHRARRQATLAPALLVATYRNGGWRQ